MTVTLPFATCAPGKVILFGEHSAVYGKLAAAASVNALRTYLHVEKTTVPGTLQLVFPDIHFEAQWGGTQLRTVFGAVQPTVGPPPLQLDEQLLARVQEFAESSVEHPVHVQAAICFLYLFAAICGAEDTGLRFVLKSTSPIGAGLGSSAAISVALSTAMLHLRDTAPGPTLSQVNGWSLLGEKCIHGDPSGIDNAVATYGGVISYRKGHQFQFITLPDHLSAKLRLLVTYTGVPRSTKQLVQGVRDLYERDTLLVEPILEAMDQCAQRAVSCLEAAAATDTALPSTLLELATLINVNQGLLCSLGVSHPALERVKLAADTAQIGSTKLTGAGGGGCAITLLADGCTPTVLRQFQESLQDPAAGSFETYETLLGGLGAALLGDPPTGVSALFRDPSATAADLETALTPGIAPVTWTPLKP
ncbi:mevalonate kinase KNAG_0J01960 [Huiozyma naganishii CBS 8797]|uniref:Mevalonate kinase n=1 Tax=Huiozyma naganishii (strain ATCC MYA-139 / BCRC 22969 / CBS 8797 / KCTC 17520 / NBRC 10181 / NCYC 3082 / Yp74L-3) TaxID=1071383 RepID=J7S2W4_HUIN7|nr:hypothetical protein KNAG_0J01960 [Kazachstania naganishii CBS 8797]CCK72277.1 hypothetical protein KNAG_0J01960 [Kazachstania naganishii CBS 8797]